MNITTFLIIYYPIGSVFRIGKDVKSKGENNYSRNKVEIIDKTLNTKKVTLIENKNTRVVYLFDWELGDLVRGEELDSFEFKIEKFKFVKNNINSGLENLEKFVETFLGGKQNFKYSNEEYKNFSEKDSILNFKDLKILYNEIERLFYMSEEELKNENIKDMQLNNTLNILLYCKRYDTPFYFKNGKILLDRKDPDFNIKVGYFNENIPIPKYNNYYKLEGYFFIVNDITYILDITNMDFSLVKKIRIKPVEHNINFDLLFECFNKIVKMCSEDIDNFEIRNDLILRVLTIIDMTLVSSKFETFDQAKKFFLELNKIY